MPDRQVRLGFDTARASGCSEEDSAAVAASASTSSSANLSTERMPSTVRSLRQGPGLIWEDDSVDGPRFGARAGRR